jgi:hypothetical protein
MPRQKSDDDKSAEQLLSAWLDRHQNGEIVHHAEALPLRRDIETLLTYVRDNKVVGTQGPGNMPLKAVREVTARFVKPPKLEDKIGSHVIRIRSEADLWPLYFLRILAEVGGLLKIGSARRWRLTRKGEKFLDAQPMRQLAFLLTTWWYKVNWLIAYSYTGMGDSLPESFNLFTLDDLLGLPAKTRIPFEEFADALIGKTGLTWGKQESSFRTTALRGSIARMVIHILAAFGAIEREYEEEPVGKGTTSRLVAFEITPLGASLLEAVAINTRAVV